MVDDRVETHDTLLMVDEVEAAGGLHQPGVGCDPHWGVRFTWWRRQGGVWQLHGVDTVGQVVVDAGFALWCVRGKDELESFLLLDQRLHLHVELMKLLLQLIGLTLEPIGQLSASVAAFRRRQLVSLPPYVSFVGLGWCQHVIGNFSFSSRRSFRFNGGTGG